MRLRLDQPKQVRGDVQRDSLDQQATAEVTETAKLLPEEESQAVDRTASAEELYELVYGQPSDRSAGAGSDAADGDGHLQMLANKGALLRSTIQWTRAWPSLLLAGGKRAPFSAICS